MKILNISIKEIPFAVLLYGLFFVLCHVVAVLFYFRINSGALHPVLLVRRCAGMLEYTLMSLTLLTAGGMLLELTVREE